MSSQPMQPDDRRTLTLRLGVLQYLLATAFAALAVSFWMFQVAHHERFREMAENNHMRRLPLPAPRGVLVDRNGKVLVQNQDVMNIVLVREQTKDIESTLRTLALATGADFAQLKETVDRRRRDPSYRPIILIENASRPQVVAVAARSLEMPGVEFQPMPARKYDGNLAAHLFGYVGEVNEAQLARADYKDLGAGAIVGQAGVEQAYNRLLMGTEGYREMIVNSRGREIGKPTYEQQAREGTGLQLTIDADLQKAAEDGFAHFGVINSGKPYNGAAVVLDPRSGEVLSLVSLPAYDPNKFAVGLDAATWKSLITDKAKPLSNRALQATYSPGSTFKLVVATAAMEEGLVKPDFRVHCPRRRVLLRTVVPVSSQGGTRQRGHAPRHREILQHLLLHSREHAWCRSHPQMGHRARSGSDQRHRFAERTSRARSLDGMETPREEGKVVRR